MLAEALVCDERIVRMAVNVETPVLLVRADDGNDRFERIDAASRWAGVALVPGALVREVSRRFGDWDLQSTVLRSAVHAGARRLRWGGLPVYLPDSRPQGPPIL